MVCSSRGVPAALIQPLSRQAYAQLLPQGWTDALLKLQPEGRSGRSGATSVIGDLWTRECGWIISFSLHQCAIDSCAEVWTDGLEVRKNASGHAPAWIILDR